MSQRQAARPENLNAVRLGFVGDGEPTRLRGLRTVREALLRRHPISDTVDLGAPERGSADRARWVDDAAERCDAVVMAVTAVDEATNLIECCDALEDRGVPCVLLVPAAIRAEVNIAIESLGLDHLAVLEISDAEQQSSRATALVLSIEHALASDPSSICRFQEQRAEGQPGRDCEC